MERLVNSLDVLDTSSRQWGHPEATTHIQRWKGELTIQMGTGRDAVVKLVKSDSGQASIAVYIRSDSSTTVTGIPDGVYRVLYATGDGYNAQHTHFS